VLPRSYQGVVSCQRLSVVSKTRVGGELSEDVAMVNPDLILFFVGLRTGSQGLTFFSSKNSRISAKIGDFFFFKI